jgi:hypothetical protein
MVFVFAMSALKQASKTRLQRYAERIRELSEDFPGYWWVIGMADIHMRSEHLERVRRDCAKRHAKGDLPDFDPARPWDVTFREAALDDKFWHKEVDKKILLFSSSLTPMARIADPGFGVIEESVAGAGRSGGGSASHALKRRQDRQSDSSSEEKGGKKRKTKKKRAKASKPDATSGQRMAKKQLKKADHKRPDGRYVRDAEGVEICFRYAHQESGCQENCPNGRAHICEWCRGEHRSIECRRKPNGWKP